VKNCPYCRSPASLFVRSGDRNRHVSSEVFSYFRCTECGLIFIDPIPTDLEPYYAGGYQPVPKTIAELRLLASHEKYRLKPIMNKMGGDLLEIGPWIGIFSINAKDAGFKVDAIEMSPVASSFLRETVGIDVTTTNNPAEALAAAKRYDVIAMWHSLEHFPSPWTVLEAAANRLKPGGTLLIAIPNIASLQAKTLRENWFHLDAPRHLFFWAPEDLARLINAFGLETIALDTRDRLSQILSIGAWEHYIYSKVRIPLLRGVAAKLFSPLAHMLTQRNDQGAGLTAIFRAP
jgi:2-polyprenyl-3-methyl-5-hydroxy-6-metoxy-1,4-benzoquinol methylase